MQDLYQLGFLNVGFIPARIPEGFIPARISEGFIPASISECRIYTS